MVLFHVWNFCFYHTFIWKGILTGPYVRVAYLDFVLIIRYTLKYTLSPSVVHQSCPTLLIHVTFRQLDLRRVLTSDTSRVENFSSSYVAKIEFDKFYMTSVCSLTLWRIIETDGRIKEARKLQICVRFRKLIMERRIWFWRGWNFKIRMPFANSNVGKE